MTSAPSPAAPWHTHAARAMIARLLVLASAVLLAGCVGIQSFRPADPVEEPAAYLVFDLEEVYDVVDIRYERAVVSDSGVASRPTVQVLARRRDTGEHALLIYDAERLRQGPQTVIELRAPDGGL